MKKCVAVADRVRDAGLPHRVTGIPQQRRKTLRKRGNDHADHRHIASFISTASPEALISIPWSTHVNNDHLTCRRFR
ncbi:hypothetical protein SAMN05216569_0592 [Pseudoxanthomonas sp. CF125]|nr:hypothetical protein SAMN05216569_0592 [Pseudoxanthomonas sp. CF125]